MIETRTLHTPGLTVTRMGLGLAALGRPGYINLNHAEALNHSYEVEQMEAHTHAILDQAWAAGVRYFDCARSYGKAEEFLASWLRARGIAPVAVTVGSKWGYTYTADWQVDAEVHEVKEHTLEVLTRQCGESRENLGPHLDLYQVHSATLSSGILDRPEVHRQLAVYKAQGLALGLSLSGERQAQTLERALELEVDGVRLFDTVQATWNLLERSAGLMLQAAHEAGMGVIIKEAVANGRLTPANNDPDFEVQRGLLEQVAEAQGVTVDAVALAGVLARPWVDVVLSGAAASDHLQANLRAFDVEWSEDIEAILMRLTEPPTDYWETRSALEWN